VGGPGVGHRAASLPWLCPAAGGFLALADDPPDVDTILNDPALIVHILRVSHPTAQKWTAAELSDPAVLATAALHLESLAVGRSDWSAAIDPRILDVARSAAVAAAELHPADPTRARIAAVLAPLGWYAVAAVDPAAASPNRVYSWGLPADAIARRLMRTWGLPAWLEAIVGNLSHPAEVAESLGADPAIFRAVQAAVGAAERAILDLRLAPNADPDLVDRAAEILHDHPHDPLPARFGVEWDTDPRANPLVTPLLKAKAETRKTMRFAPLGRAEAEIDTLRDLLAEAHERFSHTVQEAKLTALAELAAGAGHEINNPLAVISGHCQRLLSHEEDEETRATLETVVRQTKRIHDILRGLMQFARPAKPTPHPVRMAELVGSALAEVRNLAAVKAVELREELSHPGQAVCDLHQLKTCLANLLRNAVEAAGPDGWVRVQSESAGDRVQVVIEDSGPGPTPGQAAHLFDPFYSGKAAGRGRGLGLSVAWRLAAVNGATLRHEPTAASPARFVLSIPAAAETAARIPA
jgi:signal transduction histidine kinase